jgi:hypothetical protein
VQVVGEEYLAQDKRGELVVRVVVVVILTLVVMVEMLLVR